jgi:exodeoxyribonuclease V alpha subunit
VTTLATAVLPAELVARLREADVPDETIALADEAASWAKTPLDEQRAFALVVAALCESRDEGSTRLPLGTLGARLGGMGAAPPERDAALALGERLPAALPSLVGSPGEHKPFILEDGCLYAERDLRLEERLASELAARLARPEAELDARAVAAAVDESAPAGRRWTPEQAAALAAAVRRPLTLVTGGPGTGKTALLAGILRALVRLGVAPDEIALAAPTGRAANRIAETLPADIGGAPPPAPRTIHRLLGFRGHGFLSTGGEEVRHHENYPLPHRAVLVDETSMVDLALMERLVRAVRADARLVLLGDSDQLPSVEAGAVFRDLGPLAFALAQSHRMSPDDPGGAAVLAAARAVRAGDLSALPAPLADPARLAFVGFEHLEPAGPAPAADRRLLAGFLDRWYETRVRALPGYDALCARTYRLPLEGDDAAGLSALLAHHRRLRLLALPRGAHTPGGAEALNLAMVRRASAGGGADLAPGTPVLMSRNDYLRGLYNGDQGVVARVAAPGQAPALAAAFPRAGGAGIALFPLGGIRHDLHIGYASTVHKAQGAELEHAALVLPERDLPLLSRELLYTALTRVRRGVVVVGRRALLEAGAARPLARASGLRDRLLGKLGTRP